MSFENLDESIPILIFRLIISPIAIFGNCIILYIVLRFKEFRLSVINCLMGLLAFGQLFVGIGSLMRALYSLYNSSENITSYNRFSCLVIALPQVFGIIFAQIILLSMAIDRLLAVSRPTAYFQSKSLIRVYIGAVIAFIFGCFYSFFTMWHVEESPAEQCSAGAAAKPAVITAYTYYGMVMAVSIFAVYTATIIFLIKRYQTTDHSIALSRQRPKKAFTTISLILLFYAIFWCIPLFTLIVVEATSNDPILLGYISLLIAIFSDLYSCVAIFVYLAKHPELREYFMKEIAKFSRLIQLTDRRTQAPHLHNLNKHTDREQNQGDIPN